MSGARGIYRRLRVVEHGCCGRGANLVSVQFVKRSAGDNERQRRTRAKRIREADRAVSSKFDFSVIKGVEKTLARGLEKTRVRFQVSTCNTSYRATDISQTCHRSAIHQKRNGCTDTHMSLNDTHATTCRVRIVVNVYARDQMRAPCGAGRAASPTARWSQQGRARV